MKKPFIYGIDIDFNAENNINIVLITSEGKKKLTINEKDKGCTICCSIAGGISPDTDGIFLTKNGNKTEKI